MSEDKITTKENTRWVGLSTYYSVVLVSSFIIGVLVDAAGYIDMGAIPELAYFVYIALVLASGYYALGDEAVDSGTEKVMDDK